MPQASCPTTPSDLLTDGELQHWLRVDRQTTFRWRAEYDLPHIFVGGRVRYRRADVERWIEQRTAERMAAKQGGGR